MSSCWFAPGLWLPAGRLAVKYSKEYPPKVYRELIKLSFITFYSYTYVMFNGLANVGLSLAITTTTRENLDKMATRSMIGLQAEDGTIEAIYCHYDGYPEYQLHTLRKHFSSPEKVKELMRGGDISSLWSEHNWERQPKEAGPLYYNERGESTSSRFYKSVGEYSLGAFDCACEWVYYMDQGEQWNHHQCDQGFDSITCPQTVDSEA